MVKNKKTVTALVFFFVILFISFASASTATYDFNDDEADFNGYKDLDNDVYPPDNTLPPDSSIELSTGDKVNIQNSDDIRESQSTPEDAENYVYFNSTVGSGTISAINWSFEGYYDDSQTPSSAKDISMHFFIWNNSASEWYECATNITDGSSDVSRSCYFSSDASDFYDAGLRSYFMLWATDPDDANALGGSMKIDHVKLDVTTTLPPTINIVVPADLEEFNTNVSLPLNFTTTNETAIDTIWYNIDNGPNTTITSNTTFNTSDGSHTVYMFINDSSGNSGSDSATFTVSLDAPAITLDYPGNATYFNNGTNVYLNYTATDSNGISQCQIWHNLNGSFSLNQTNNGVTSGEQNFTTINGGDGSYLWNVWCNDTTGQSKFSANNRTFIIDETDPFVTNITVNTQDNSQTINFSFDISETNQNTCKYSILDSGGSIDGLNENVSISCSENIEATVSDYGTFTLRVFHLDLAGNENSTDENFTTVQATTTTTGGGGGSSGEDVELIPVVGLNDVNGTSIYSELERETIYAKINKKCGSKEEGENGQFLAIIDYSGTCSLTVNDLENVNKELSELGFNIDSNDLVSFFRKYKDKDFIQGYEKREDVIKYGLFTSVLGIPNPMVIQPSTLRRPFFKFSLDEAFNITHTFIVNKNIRECTVLEGDSALTCELITNNTFKIVYQINETDFFDQTFTGRVSVTSDAEPENLEVKDVPLVLTVYNFASPILGIPAFAFLGGLFLIVSVGGIVIYRNKQFRKKLLGKK